MGYDRRLHPLMAFLACLQDGSYPINTENKISFFRVVDVWTRISELDLKTSQ